MVPHLPLRYKFAAFGTNPSPDKIPDTALNDTYHREMFIILSLNALTIAFPTAAIGQVLLAILLVVLCLVAWASNLVALPGNWAAVLLVGLYVWLGPETGREAIGGGALVAAFYLLWPVKLLNSWLVPGQAHLCRASCRAMLYAMLGSMVGAILGAIIGVPIPLVGSVIAAILFGGLGATAGAMYGEWTNGKPWKESWTIGHAAFWGRTVGTLGKMSAGLGVVAIGAMGVVF